MENITSPKVDTATQTEEVRIFTGGQWSNHWQDIQDLVEAYTQLGEKHIRMLKKKTEELRSELNERKKHSRRCTCICKRPHFNLGSKNVVAEPNL